MDVDKKICEFEDYKRNTSVSHYHPIEYMTEYGYEQKNEQICESDNLAGLSKPQKFGHNCKRKPNLSVLRNKLNLHFKKSDYKDKVNNSVIEPDLADMSFDSF